MAIFPTRHIQMAKEMTNCLTSLVTREAQIKILITPCCLLWLSSSLCVMFSKFLCVTACIRTLYCIIFQRIFYCVYVRLWEGGHLDHLQTLPLQILLLWTWFCRYLCVHVFFCGFTYLGIELISLPDIWRNCVTLLQNLHHFMFSSATSERIQIIIIFANCVCLLNFKVLVNICPMF